MRQILVRHRILLGLIAIATLSSLFLTRNIDFRVYWYATRAFADHSCPLYGPASGVGFPMHYRYPPITYLLLRPIAGLPLNWAGVLWVMGAWAAMMTATALMIRAAKLQFSPASIIAASAYLLAYAVLGIRSGNIQPYLIAMILAAFALSESRRTVAASLLALAITFKLWPIFFLPWFLSRGRRQVVVRLIPILLLLWLAPLTVWSPYRYYELLAEWYSTELQTAMARSEIWYFPGQSLRGVLLRYLTTAEPWLTGFPDVHLCSLPPGAVIHGWEAIAATIYSVVCVVMFCSGRSKQWIWDGLAFAMFTLLQPFCVKSSMISLAPAVFICAALYSCPHPLSRCERLARGCFLSACALSLIGALSQYRPILRLWLALGIDFYAAVLLAIALCLWIQSREHFPDAIPRESRADPRRTDPHSLITPVGVEYRGCSQAASDRASEVSISSSCRKIAR